MQIVYRTRNVRSAIT